VSDTYPPQGLTFSSDSWRARFAGWGWADFDALWRLAAEAVEPANVRRGGWSSVVRFEAPDGSAFYLKRQEDHDFRVWRGGLRHLPTVLREWQVGLAFRALEIDTAEPVCIGLDDTQRSRGLLVTVALDEHRSLTDVLQQPHVAGDVRRELWWSLADKVRRIHDHGFRHNCLYGQHILVKQTEAGWQCCFIDLEKASRTRRRNRAVIADLSALDRHTDDMSTRDRQWLWDRYFVDVPLARRRRMLRILAKRSALRGVDQYIRDCAAGRRGEAPRRAG
jgi:hypothetical protein